MPLCDGCVRVNILRDRGYDRDDCGRDDQDRDDRDDRDGRDGRDYRDYHDYHDYCDDHESFSLILNGSRNIHAFLEPNLLPIG